MNPFLVAKKSEYKDKTLGGEQHFSENNILMVESMDGWSHPKHWLLQSDKSIN
jgi:hypothetical protein